MLEYMFEALDLTALAAADDVAVAEAVEGWARAEAVGAAGRLAAIAELVERRCGADEDRVADVREYWSCDLWDATAAEIGAALNVSARRASSQMYLAQSLRYRLPRVNAVFTSGGIAARLVSTISWRTHLVTDTAAMAAIDAAIAEAATKWGVLSDAKVEQLIDTLVDEHDPKAREWFEAAARGMDIEFGKPDDVTGTRSLWGRLYSTHAELIERKLAAMVRAVCPADPRTVGQRRAEAMGVVFAGGERIDCQCGSPECPNLSSDALAGSVVIHVVADQATVTAPVAEIAQSGPVAPAEDAPHRAALRRPAAVMSTGGVVPAPLLAQLIRNGAAVVPLRTPCEAVENRYRPSVGLQRFVRCRDLTCRFPGCNAPAEVCDIDHAIAYPVGATHPSNLRCLCRKHHLLKTFYVGVDGWSDRQLPDGTIIWTAPTGRTYTTYPGSRVSFPEWNVTTAELPAPSRDPAAASHRGLQMPLRARTRAADRARRIKSRRAQHDSS
jgi:hypothetical protein